MTHHIPSTATQQAESTPSEGRVTVSRPASGVPRSPSTRGGARRIGFARLIWVEIRKLLDTRSSLAIFAVLAVIGAALVVGFALLSQSQGSPVTFAGLAGSVGLFTALAMPLIGILGMTSDIVHRTTYVYYPLLAGRAGQFWAKVVAAAAVALSLQLFVLLLTAAIAGIVMGNTPGSEVFQDAPRVAAQGFATCLLSTMFGVALAAAIRRTALAIVAVILITLVGNGLIITLLPDASGYLSTITAVGVLAGGPDAPSALEVCTSLAIWYVLPLGIGWWITEKGEA